MYRYGSLRRNERFTIGFLLFHFDLFNAEFEVGFDGADGRKQQSDREVKLSKDRS